MKVNPWKNCVIVRKISHLYIKITQEKVFDGLYNLNERKIEGILTLPKVN